jgi:hypothetical protein
MEHILHLTGPKIFPDFLLFLDNQAKEKKHPGTIKLSVNFVILLYSITKNNLPIAREDSCRF